MTMPMPADPRDPGRLAGVAWRWRSRWAVRRWRRIARLAGRMVHTCGGVPADPTCDACYVSSAALSAAIGASSAADFVKPYADDGAPL